VAANGTFAPGGSGTPGVWRLGVGADGALARALVPPSGLLADRWSRRGVLMLANAALLVSVNQK
jgi:hypothetical protein